MAAASPPICPVCGAANQAQAKYCQSCGRPLQGAQLSIYHSATGRLLANVVLKQRYHILKSIGKGGMGAVYQAEDMQLGNRAVALKEMSQSGLSPQELQEAVQAFQQEALMLARLNHPNLPSIFDHFEQNGRWYLAMSFIQGQTLEEYLQVAPGGRLPLSEVVNIGIQLCTVLDYLHHQQPPIIFRDLKPANIMRTASGHLYLIDFGIARHFKPGQSRDTIAYGSMGYAPPEQYGKAQTTPRSDIYSLGATLHQLVSGHDPTASPFHFPSLSSLVPGVQASFASLITQMLAVDEMQRPADVRLVQQQLQALASQPAGPGALLFTINGHSREVSTVAWSPDGTHLASASWDNTAQVWNGADGRRLLIYRGHTDSVRNLTWSPDGTRLASASHDGTIQVWNATDGRLLLTYRHHSGTMIAVAWSPDDTRLASGGEDSTVQVWNVADGKPLFTYRGHSEPVMALAWSPDGKRLASGSYDHTAQVWSAADGRLLLTYRGHSNEVTAVAWSPDGTHLASASSWGNTVQVWNAADGNPLFTYRGHSELVMALAWSPDGTRLASGSCDQTVQVWNAADGKSLFTYRGHSHLVTSLAWSPDGTRLASGSCDSIVQVWTAP